MVETFFLNAGFRGHAAHWPPEAYPNHNVGAGMRAPQHPAPDDAASDRHVFDTLTAVCGAITLGGLVR